MIHEKYEYLLNPDTKKKRFWTIAGWTAYVLFGLLSTLVVMVATGFWPVFAWILALIFGPKIWKSL